MKMPVSWDTTMSIRYYFACLLIMIVTIDSLLVQSTYFRAVLWSNGTSVCALQTPSEYFTVSSVVSCSAACKKTNAYCGNFNYNSKSKVCETFASRPSCYGYVSPSCQHYEMESYPTKADTGIPAEQCRFPFTYNLSLYESCASNLMGDGCMNCMGPSWTIDRCQQPANFQPKSTEVTISIPTFGSSVPVLSINRWIIFQYRFDGTLSFQQNWATYKAGFGSPPGEYWLGLEKVSQLTNNGQYRGRFEMQTLGNSTWYSVEYDSFVIDPESQFYAIHVNGYHGDCGDLFNYPLNAVAVQNGMNFSTFDSDNDRCDIGGTYNCVNASGGYGGYWNNCCSGHNFNNPFGINSNYWRLPKDLGWISDGRVNATRMMIKLI